MENASKALMFAGTILITLMVISAVVFMYRDLTSVKRQESENQKVEEIAEFNKSFESYEKDLKGAQIFSLANKITDYNIKYVDNMNEGYEKITLTVNKKNDGQRTADYYTDLQEKVDKIMNTYKSSNYLEAMYNAKNIDPNSDDDVKDQAKQTLSDLENKLGSSKYNEALKNVNNNWITYDKYKQIKNKKFKSTGITYYSNGRIKQMSYEEIN